MLLIVKFKGVRKVLSYDEAFESSAQCPQNFSKKNVAERISASDKFLTKNVAKNVAKMWQKMWPNEYPLLTSF
jgi:hypothetical protein